MKRISQAPDADKRTRRIARELLEFHSERRIAVKMHDGYFTKLIYNYGITVEEIATSYGITPRAVYAIIARQPTDCHEDGQDCTTCGAAS